MAKQLDIFGSMGKITNLLPELGHVEFYPSLFSKEECEIYMDTLKNEIGWKQEPIKIMGKEIMQPRLTAWYGDPGKTYRYSGITMQGLDWNGVLREIKQRVEEKTGFYFTNALLNYYRHGEDWMGWHRDNEKELGPEPIIGSVSFGAIRKFHFRKYREKGKPISIELVPGSLLLMKGLTNQYWEHRLPKQNRLLESRINLTFRIIQ